MNTREVRPIIDDPLFNKNLNDIMRPKSVDILFAKIEYILSKFEFEPGQIEDISKYIMESNVDDVFVNALPLYTWFSLCANKSKQKEEYYENALKTLELSVGKLDKEEKLSAKKGEVRQSRIYIETHRTLLTYSKIRRDCEVLAEAMSKKIEIARTISANNRLPENSKWLDKK